jgi:hypothetical protein
LIDQFYDAYPHLKEMQEDIEQSYAHGEPPFIKLPDGWYMWGDNENFRSVVNVPIQGTGASIMRKAVDLNHERGGAQVVFTLHDAIYIEGELGSEDKIITLMESMRDAFASFFPGKELVAKKIKLDPFAWSPNFLPDSELLFTRGEKNIIIPCSNLYIDERAKSDYDKFSKYFEFPEQDLL